MDIDENKVFLANFDYPNFNGYTLQEILDAGFVDLYLHLCQYSSRLSSLIMLSLPVYKHEGLSYNQVYINNIPTNIYVW